MILQSSRPLAKSLKFSNVKPDGPLSKGPTPPLSLSKIVRDTRKTVHVVNLLTTFSTLTAAESVHEDSFFSYLQVLLEFLNVCYLSFHRCICCPIDALT